MTFPEFRYHLNMKNQNPSILYVVLWTSLTGMMTLKTVHINVVVFMDVNNHSLLTVNRHLTGGNV